MEDDIIVEVRSGCVEVYNPHTNINVVVRDYDVEGIEGDELLEDEDGEMFVQDVY